MSCNYDFPDPEWKEVSEEAKNFIRKILVLNPEERYTAEQCLNDPWIKEYAAPAKDLRRLQSFSVQKFKKYNDKYKASNASPVKLDDETDK